MKIFHPVRSILPTPHAKLFWQLIMLLWLSLYGLDG